MGTQYTVKLARLPEGIDLEVLSGQIRARLETVNAAMSTYLPDSEVSRFSRHQGEDWFPVSPETARVVETALRIGASSGGALDITVAPVVDLWGFGPGPRRTAPPSDDEVARARRAVGLEKIDVRADPPAIRKKDAATAIDLSAVAKGFAVDEVARHLEAVGVESYMVEIGGEVRTRGVKGSGSPWTIGIVTPDDDRFGVERLAALGDRAMATSGDYRNFFEFEGRRYSHTIDPRTGRPVTHDLASVSVVAATCMEADALATALLVLGPESGYRLAVELKLAALFIRRASNGTLSQRATPAMEEILATR
jgi:thiamine biosynthesis lipoprotein